ncbi:MAG: PH domain-containing protein, partial [bacterium]
TVRGYQLRGSFLLVRRLGWYTRIDLTDLSSSQYDPQAMASSIRTFGNGGLFGFSGKYWNRELGSYKVYATNPENAVVLRLGKKVLVVTPDNPNDFVAALQRCL